MANINRTMDSSEQKEEYGAVTGALATGATAFIGIVPYPCTVVGTVFAGSGISGTPTGQIAILRQVAAGATTIKTYQGLQGVPDISATYAVSATYSPSFLLQAKDVLVYVTGGANSAVTNAVVKVIVQKTQDFVTYF